MSKTKPSVPDGDVLVTFMNAGDPKCVSGADNDCIGNSLIDQAAAPLLPYMSSTKAQISQSVQATLELQKALAPRDPVEGVLAAQLVATHNAGMACLKQGMRRDGYFPTREQDLKYGIKLLALSVRITEALDRHRGVGQPAASVGTLNVHGGGQAIVGNVTSTSAGEGRVSAPAQPALSHQPNETVIPLEIPDAEKKTRSRERVLR